MKEGRVRKKGKSTSAVSYGMDSRSAATTTFSTEASSDEMVPSSLKQIAPILRVATEFGNENPRVAYLCRRYALEKAHRLDERSTGHGVRQFKTALEQQLERDDTPSVEARVKKTDASEIESFYKQYYEKYVKAFDQDEKADRSQHGEVYQVAGALFEVLCSVNKFENAEEVPADIIASARDVVGKQVIYDPCDILSLDSAEESQCIKQFEVIRASVSAPASVNQKQKKSGGLDLLDWLRAVFGFQKNVGRDQREHLTVMCQGQYRSTLKCLICNFCSLSLNTFLCLHLPLPTTTMRTMELTVLSTDGSTLPSQVTVAVPENGKFKDLILALTTACCLGDDETLLVAEIYVNRVIALFDESDSLELVRQDDVLVAYRLLKEEDSLPLVVFTHCYEVFTKYGSNKQGSLMNFWIPTVARIRDCNDSNEIRKKFLESVRPFRVIKESCVDAYDDPTRRSFEFKLTQDSLLSKKSIKVMDEESSKSPSPKYFLVTWPGEMLEQYDTSTLSHLPQTGGLPLFTGTPEPVSLYDCLEALFKEELLGTEEMWYCPECKIKRPANKKLDIWSFPEILIVQLKRFSRGQVGNKLRADNLKTFVDFPIHDLDISKCAAYKDSQPSATYKLYGISNHHYDTSIGDRYTAYAQRGEHWYKTDGIKVTRISEDAIRTSAAYLLFYKRTSS